MCQSFHALTLRLTVNRIRLVQVNTRSFRLSVQNSNPLIRLSLHRTLFDRCSAILCLDHTSSQSLPNPTSQSPRSPRLAATDSASAVAPDLRGGSSLNSSSHAYRVRQEARSKCIHHRNTLEPALEQRRLLRQKPTCVIAVSPHALPQWSLLIQLLQNRNGFVIRMSDCDRLSVATRSDTPRETGAP